MQEVQFSLAIVTPRLFCLVFMDHQSTGFFNSKFLRTEVCLCVRSIHESALLHTPQYLGFIQTHPLGSISTLAFTGWSQDTLCNCWSKVGRNRSRLKKKREKEYEKLLTVSLTDHMSEELRRPSTWAGESISIEEMEIVKMKNES